MGVPEKSKDLRQKYIKRKILHYAAQIDMGSRNESTLLTLEAYLTAEREMNGQKVGKDEAIRAERFFRSEAEYFHDVEDIAQETTWAVEYAERALICEEVADELKKLQNAPETRTKRKKKMES